MSAPWWEAELPEVDRELRSHLRSRLPSLSWEHDDLVNETLLALSIWMRRHSRMSSAPVAESATLPDRRELFALARVILRRRIADHFRLSLREWRQRVDMDEATLSKTPSQWPSVEREVLLRQMLEITIGVLATLKAEDRDLIAMAGAGAPRSRILTPRERQRLKRARRKIIEAIVAKLGAPVMTLLRREE